MNTGAKVALVLVGTGAIGGGAYYLATRSRSAAGTTQDSLYSPGVSGATNAGGSKANASGGTVSLAAPASGQVGSPVLLTATASNINNPVYQFWYETPSGVFTQDPQGYSAQNAYQFTPTQSGTYRVIAYARAASAPGNEASLGLQSRYEANSDILAISVS